MQPGICVLALVASAPTLAAEQLETDLPLSPLTDDKRVNIAGEDKTKASLGCNKLSVMSTFMAR